MRKIKGLVVSIDIPKECQGELHYPTTIVVPVKAGYRTTDNGETWEKYIRRVALTGKRLVYTKYRPVIGSWIEVTVF